MYNHLLDGDMETAGVGCYGVFGDNVLSKDATTPQSGSQCLKIANAVTSPVSYFKDTNNSHATIEGQYYRIQGYGAGNGTVAPSYNKITSGGVPGDPYWTGLRTTNWQAFDITQMRNSKAELGYLTGDAAGYVRFDDISCVLARRGLVLDGTMEEDAIARWTESNSSCAKGSDANGRYLRITRTTTDYPSAVQSNCLLVQAARKYYVKIRCRGDGVTGRPLFMLGTGSVAVFIGTISTDIQTFEGIVTSGAANRYIWAAGYIPGAGGYVDFFELQVIDLSVAHGANS